MPLIASLIRCAEPRADAAAAAVARGVARRRAHVLTAARTRAHGGAHQPGHAERQSPATRRREHEGVGAEPSRGEGGVGGSGEGGALVRVGRLTPCRGKEEEPDKLGEHAAAHHRLLTLSCVLELELSHPRRRCRRWVVQIWVARRRRWVARRLPQTGRPHGKQVRSESVRVKCEQQPIPKVLHRPLRKPTRACRLT